MIEESLLKSNYLGKDGFIWWLGQVAPPEVWDKDDKVGIDFTKHSQAWAYRCKVRIIGYHTYDRTELPDKDLPWAHVLVSPSDGNAQGGLGKTHKLIGGETVFGFFLDGDDAQQPVVIGSIYRNANVPSFDVDEIAFKPFTGHTKGSRVVKGPTKQVAKTNTSQGEPSNSGGNIIGGLMQDPTSVGIDTTFSKNSDKFFPVDSALAKAYAQAEKEKIVSENGCDDNVIGKITRAIQNFIAVVSGLESYLGTYIDPILNTVVDIAQEIKRTARIITGTLKFLINNMRNIIMKMVGCLFSKFVGLVVPIPQQPIVGEATKNILNIIFCLFERILDQLLDFLLDMLQGLVGRAINAPVCAVEEFTATILNKLLDIIDDLLAPILSGLDWLLNGVSQVKSILSKATSIATQIFNLIGCDNLKCKTPSEWALAVGPSQAEKDNWNRVVGKMNVIRGFNDSLETSVNFLSIYGGGSSAAIFPNCADRVINPQSQRDIVNTGNIRATCIPPEVIIYGDGIGAQAVAVIGENGSILSIEVVNQGFGYSVPPSVSIIDNTNTGSGAKASSVISGGKVTQIYVTSTGSGYCETNLDGLVINPYYLVTADKYSFYEGEVCNFTILTENVTDGTTLGYTLGGEITPEDIDGPVSGTVTIFNSTASVQVKIRQDSIGEQVEQLTFDLLNSNQDIVARTVVLVNDRLSPILQIPSTNPNQSPPGTVVPIGIGTLPITLGISTFFPSLPSGIGTINSGILTGIVIPNPGIGYSTGDRIEVGECIITPIVSNNGSIVGVSSVFCPTEFTTLPTTFIDSNNGEGAVLYPVIKYLPKGNISSGIAINELGVIKVVDCV
jgi:hypothetical protein